MPQPHPAPAATDPVPETGAQWRLAVLSVWHPVLGVPLDPVAVVGLDQRHIDESVADQHYAEHVERDFYPPLRTFVTSGPLIAAVLEGDQAVEVVRAINGATDGRKAAPGTIRGDLSLSNRENLVHGSDSPESAAREIALWFPGL